MPSCELCGRQMKGRGRQVKIEGAEMLVCHECAIKFGGVSPRSDSSGSSSRSSGRPAWSGSRGPSPSSTQTTRTPVKRSPPKKKTASQGVTLDDMILVEDYAKKIRTARQRAKLTQDELAQKIGERITTLQSIESGRLKPTKKAIRGLERELDISLLEPIATVPVKTYKKGSFKGTTLGDVVKVKRKKSQKGN
ncbi:TIGR00270 family protein [Candidatus Thorarchaeota archaeon]|nr:MAG: TIGR00270 family protein [Candidatus Thorarchaeota archaeon]